MQRADGDGIAGLFQRDLYIGGDGEALWQAHGDAVAGLEGLGVDGVVRRLVRDIRWGSKGRVSGG